MSQTEFVERTVTTYEWFMSHASKNHDTRMGHDTHKNEMGPDTLK